MFRLKALARITMVQVSLGVTAVTLCLLLGLIPDHRISQIEGRERLCESLALNGAVSVHQRDLERWQAIMDVLVDRHEDLLSVAIRRKDQLVATAGNHELWPTELESSTDEFMQIPIQQKSGEEWGRLELRFEPIMPKGILMGFLTHPWTRYSALFSCICFPLFYWNLKKVLRQLDPTRAVPRNVSEAYDFLAGAMVALNAQQRIIICNSAFVQMAGISREKLLGKKLEELSWVNDAASGVVYPWQRAQEAKCQEYGVSLNYDSPTLGERTLMVNAAPVIGQANNYAGTLVNFEDITPLEETKAELEKSKEEAEAANEAKSAFLANMSHEIRTPMNAILGFADIMRRGLDESQLEREEYLGIIHSSGEHLLALINDILDLSKVESGSMQIELIECKPHVVVNDTLNTFAVKAKGKGLSLDYKVVDEVPETIHSDPLRLRQILTNLVGNALKFTESGGVSIGIERIGDDQLAFHVTDTGIGISKENIEKVFKPFSQADSSTTRKYGGTGLGLSISRKLSELMGGGLSATSVVGEGSTFTVTIDVGDLTNAEMLTEEQVRSQLKGQDRKATKKKQLPPGHILVVDDGESNRRLVRLVMERAGATIEEAVDGQEAVDMALATHYDIILMDVQMPRMDGTTAAKTLRAAGIEVPIVALTAHALGEEQKEILASGYSHLVTKPVKIDMLLALTAELLGGELTDAEDDPEPDTSALATLEVTQAEETPEQVDSEIPDIEAVGVGIEDIERDEALTVDSVRRDEALTVEIDDLDLEIQQLDVDVNPLSSAPSVEAPAKVALARIKPDNALESELPIEDEDFRDIADEFANRFIGRLSEMVALWSERDYIALAKEGHWLKGSGGTAGFSELTELGRELEMAARGRSDDECERALAKLDNAARRIWVPPKQNDNTRLSTS